MFIRHSRNAQMSRTAVRQFRLFYTCCFFPLLHGGTGERGSAACTPPRSLFISFFRNPRHRRFVFPINVLFVETVGHSCYNVHLPSESEHLGHGRISDFL
jgi:hypothetical protein